MRWYQSTHLFALLLHSETKALILNLEMSGSVDLINLFVEIGMTESKANETLKNGPLSEKLKSFIEEVSKLLEIAFKKQYN